MILGVSGSGSLNIGNIYFLITVTFLILRYSIPSIFHIGVGIL